MRLHCRRHSGWALPYLVVSGIKRAGQRLSCSMAFALVTSGIAGVAFVVRSGGHGATLISKSIRAVPASARALTPPPRRPRSDLFDSQGHDERGRFPKRWIKKQAKSGVSLPPAKRGQYACRKARLLFGGWLAAGGKITATKILWARSPATQLTFLPYAVAGFALGLMSSFIIDGLMPSNSSMRRPSPSSDLSPAAPRLTVTVKVFTALSPRATWTSDTIG